MKNIKREWFNLDYLKREYTFIIQERDKGKKEFEKKYGRTKD